MPVNGVTNYPLIPYAPRRGAAVERVVREGPSQDERTGAYSTAPERDATATSEAAPRPRRVGSSNPSTQLYSRGSGEGDSLNYSTRKALKAFADNTPTPGQQLGIELAGIDTFA